MAALLHDVFLLEQETLVHVRIERAFHRGIGDVRCPSHEMVHRLLGPVCIIYLQPVSHLPEFVVHCLEAVRRLTGKQCCRLLVAVDPGSHEVIGRIIANLQDHVRNDVRDIDEIPGSVDAGAMDVPARGTGNERKPADCQGCCADGFHECFHSLMKRLFLCRFKYNRLPREIKGKANTPPKFGMIVTISYFSAID